MGAGPERTAGLDDDHLDVVRWLAPTAARPRAGRCGRRGGTRASALPSPRRPPQPPRRRRPRAGSRLTRRVGVRGQLDRAADVPLLDALGEQLEHDCAAFLGTLEGDDDGDALQRKCAFRRPSRPVSSSYISPFSLAAKRLEQLSLLRREPTRDVHVDEHAVVAAAGAGEHGHPLPAQDAHVARLRSGLERELALAVERGDGQRRTERRLRERDVDGREDVVALAHEARILAYTHEHVGVAGHAARRAGMAFPRDPDPLAVVNPRRDGHVDGALGDRVARSLAGRAWRLDHAAHARRTRNTSACARTRRRPCETRAAAVPCRRTAGSSTGRRPGLQPAAVARLASAATWNAMLRVTPCAASASSIDTSAPTSAPRRPRPLGSEQVVAEERREEVRQAPQVERGRDEATVPQAVEAVTVVELAALGAGEHLVCLHDLLEPLVGVRGVRDVRMELAREATKRLLDGGAVRVAADAEHVVVVPPHVGVSPRRTCSRRDARAPRQPRGQS